MKKIKVNVESFEGSIVPGGERIGRCRKGDIIEVEEKTFKDMQSYFPNYFNEASAADEVTDSKSGGESIYHSISIPKDRKKKSGMIRILYLYMDDHNYRYDCWLRGEFIRQLPYFESDCCIFMYGLNIHKMYPHETPIIYDKNISFKTLKTLIQFDVVLIAQKSRMFKNYSPGGKDNKTWLPYDFVKIDVPKIVIEEDYHYETNDDWYRENKIDLILQRHYSQSLRKDRVPMIWFPFSVDVEVFKPDKKVERKNKICFVGAIEDPVYKYRSGVVEILERAGLIDTFKRHEKIYGDYVKNLQEYISHTSCGSIYNTTPAKCFEIMASGSLLFTNKFTGIDELFPSDLYCAYKNDFSDVETVARRIINNPEFVKTTTEKALQFICEHHTHKVRTKQLLNIIRSVLK